MPVSMAALVMLFHFWLTPSLTIVSIITFLLPGVAILSNLRDGPNYLDMARTSVNVAGDLMVTTLVGKSEGELNEETYNNSRT